MLNVFVDFDLIDADIFHWSLYNVQSWKILLQQYPIYVQLNKWSFDIRGNLFFLIWLSRRCLIRAAFYSLFRTFQNLLFSESFFRIMLPKLLFSPNFNMFWNCFLFLFSLSRILMSLKVYASELGIKSSFKKFWNLEKSNLDHVIRENNSTVTLPLYPTSIIPLGN